MYLSHPIRRIREDPDPDATVALVIELEGGDDTPTADDVDADEDTPTADDVAADGDTPNAGDPPTAVSATATAAGGRVVRDLGFDCHLVVVPEAAVERFCELDGIVRIETDATVSLSLDPPEEGDRMDARTTEATLREHLDGEVE